MSSQVSPLKAQARKVNDVHWRDLWKDGAKMELCFQKTHSGALFPYEIEAKSRSNGLEGYAKAWGAFAVLAASSFLATPLLSLGKKLPAFSKLAVRMSGYFCPNDVGILLDPSSQFATLSLPGRMDFNSSFAIAKMAQVAETINEADFKTVISPLIRSVIAHEIGHVICMHLFTGENQEEYQAVLAKSVGSAGFDGSKILQEMERQSKGLDQYSKKMGWIMSALLASAFFPLAASGAIATAVLGGLCLSNPREHKKAVDNFEESFADAWAVVSPLSQVENGKKDAALKEAFARLDGFRNLRNGVRHGRAHCTEETLNLCAHFLIKQEEGPSLTPEKLAQFCVSAAAKGMVNQMKTALLLTEQGSQNLRRASVHLKARL